MKKAILIHGMPSEQEFLDHRNPSPANNHWFPWVKSQLSLQGIMVQAPEMPIPFRPDYDKWKEDFEKLSPDEETILVGHSCGGGFLVRWLSENNVKVGKVVLVAPWVAPHNLQIVPGFFDFQLDPNLVSKTTGVSLMISSDDESDELETAKMLEDQVQGIKMLKFADKGHFCVGFNLKSEEFPELLEEILT